MAAPKNSLTEESLDYDLWNWKLVVSDLPGLLKERRDHLRTDNSEAVVAEHERAFGEVKDYEGQLGPYQDDLKKILAILPKDKMQGYCELKRREIREGVSSEVSGPLAKLRRGFDLAEKEAQPKLNILLSVVHECETALSLSRKHLKWVTSVAWKQGVSLPEEDQTASQVVADQHRAVVAPSSTVRNEKQRKPREEPNLRKHHVQAFAESNPGTKGKNQNQLTCADLDSHEVELPERWKRKFGVESWSAGYKHKKVRALIASMFSKYRKED